MNGEYLGCKIDYRETSADGNSCKIIFKSDIEGIATTYANLFRRSLLQNVPCMAIAGIKCKCSTGYITNYFDVVPNVTSSLLSICTKLTNARFNTRGYSNPFIVKSVISGNVNISDVVKNMEVVVGDVDSIDLTSKDELLTGIVGGSTIELSMFFNNGVGYSPKDKNIQDLQKIVSAGEMKDWIVTDSQHHSVISVGYKPSVVLGVQEIVLDVVNSSGQIRDVVRGCRDNIIKQLQFDLD